MKERKELNLWRVLGLVVVILLVIFLFYYIKSLKPEVKNMSQSISQMVTNLSKKDMEENQAGANKINFWIDKQVVSLGETIVVRWDSSKIPNGAGVSLNIIKPDGDYISGTGASVPPKWESYKLTIPDSFYGFVDGGDYYVDAYVTVDKDPNSGPLFGVIYSPLKFKIVSKK